MSAIYFLTYFSVLIPATLCIRYLFEGEVCALKDGSEGICGTFSDCGNLYNIPRNPPKICSTRGMEDIICCPPEYIKKKTTPTTILPSPTPSLPSPKPEMFDDTEACSLLVNGDTKARHTLVSEKACSMYRTAHDSYSRGLDILGGVNVTDISKYPYMAALGYPVPETDEYAYNCGGMLISDRFVLTAAHCEINGRPVVVLLGSLYVDRPDFRSQMIDVATFIVHPCYQLDESYYDIALIKLREKVQVTDYIFPACITTDPEPEVDRDYDVLGWGATNYIGTKKSTNLLRAHLRVQHPDTCYSNWQPDHTSRLPRGFAKNTMLCAIDPNDYNSTCRGDSGGPLSVKNSSIHYTVVGVISQGGAGCGDDKPGILTKIYPFLLWIEDVIWPDGETEPLEWSLSEDYGDYSGTDKDEEDDNNNDDDDHGGGNDGDGSGNYDDDDDDDRGNDDGNYDDDYHGNDDDHGNNNDNDHDHGNDNC